jgi:hypothetical protein
MIPPVVQILCILVAIGSAVFSLTTATTPYPVSIAAVLFVLAVVFSQDPETTRIPLLATGELLVIAAALTSFTSGVVIQLAVIGAVFLDRPGLPKRWDALLFVFWCLATLAGSAILYFSNQILIPFLAITTGAAGITALLVGVEEIRERRAFAKGAE